MRTLSVLLAAIVLAGAVPALAETVPAPVLVSPGKKKTVVKPVPRAVTKTPLAAPVSMPDALREQQDKLARERQDLERVRGTTLDLVRLLVEEGVISREKAAAMLPEADRAVLADVVPKAKTAAVEPAPVADAKPEQADTSAPGRRKRAQTVRVPYVPETVKAEIREQIKQEVLAQAKSERWAEPGSLPEWLDRITWEGDVRLRYQGDFFSPANTDVLTYNAVTGANLGTTTADQERWRVRARLGLTARVSDTLFAGIRLSTGAFNNPVTTNQTAGNTFQPYQIFVDRAFIRWDPSERWSFAGGRIANPWFWPTELLWDEYLNFEGAAGSWKPKFSETIGGFLTAGAFPLQYTAPTPQTPDPKNKWLFGVQGGVEWQPGTQTRLKLAAGLFDFQNVAGEPNRDPFRPNLNDWSVPQFRQKGNTVFDINFGTGNPTLLGLASKFKVFALSSEVSLAQLDPYFVTFAAEYAKNIGFDQDNIRARTGVSLQERTTAYQAKLTVGADAIRKFKDWQAFVGYRYIENDAVLDAFTDSQFNLGGTNAKGYILGGLFGIDRNAWIRARWFSANPISGPPLAIDTFQMDFNVRF